MIRHCVFIRFRADVTPAQKAGIYAELEALKPRLPGLLAVHLGDNVSPETGMDKGFGQGFVIDFADAAARDIYLADPVHRRTGEKIVAAAVGGLDGIFVYDIETSGA